MNTPRPVVAVAPYQTPAGALNAPLTDPLAGSIVPLRTFDPEVEP